MASSGSTAPSMYSKVVDVISKAPDVRKDFEVQSILPWFRKKSQVFQKVKTDFLKDIIRNCRFITKYKHDIIIKQGDLGECFYIILGGKISIYILNKEDLDNQDSEDLTKDPTKDRGLEDGQSLRVTDRATLGNFVCHLGPGDPFGEVALVSEDCVRTASVISDDTTDLVVVDRALYNRSVRDVLAQEFEEKTSFIKGTPLFSNWAPKYRKQLAMAMYKETFPYESWLVRQGEKVDNIYFIINGQVEVQIDTATHSQQYPKLFPVEESEFGDRIKRKVEGPRAEVKYSPQHRKRHNKQCLKVCYLGINASVGDTEVLMDMPTYLQSAVCSERTDVLVLERKHYERLFVKRHPKTIDAMRRILEIKLSSRLALSINKDMPLLDNLLRKLASINNPQPQTEKPKREIVTYQDAEKQFLNHKGPLIDMWGPGSVFYAIRLREKLKSRRRFHTRPGMNARHAHGPPRGHPSLMAASRAALQQQTAETKQDVSRTVVHVSASEQNQPVGELNKQEPQPQQETEEVNPEVPRGHFVVKSQSSLGHYDNTDDRHSRPGSLRLTTQRGATFMTESRLEQRRFTSPDDETFLQSLEDRMRDWLSNVNPRGTAQVQQLRRMAVQNLDQQPKPGNKVIIRRRKRDVTSPETVSSGYFDEEDEDTVSYEHFKVLLDR